MMNIQKQEEFYLLGKTVVTSCESVVNESWVLPCTFNWDRMVIISFTVWKI